MRLFLRGCVYYPHNFHHDLLIIRRTTAAAAAVLVLLYCCSCCCSAVCFSLFFQWRRLVMLLFVVAAGRLQCVVVALLWLPQEVEVLTLYKSIVEDGPDLFSLHNPTSDAPFRWDLSERQRSFLQYYCYYSILLLLLQYLLWFSARSSYPGIAVDS